MNNVHFTLLFDEPKICDSELSFARSLCFGFTLPWYKSEFILLLDPDSYREQKLLGTDSRLTNILYLKYNLKFYSFEPLA